MGLFTLPPQRWEQSRKPMTLTEFDNAIAEYTKRRQSYLAFRKQVLSGEITKDTPGFQEAMMEATKNACMSALMAARINKNVWPDPHEL